MFDPLRALRGTFACMWLVLGLPVSVVSHRFTENQRLTYVVVMALAAIFGTAVAWTGTTVFKAVGLAGGMLGLVACIGRALDHPQAVWASVGMGICGVTIILLEPPQPRNSR